ncbi:transglutaminase domain-containing protein [Paenibacillus brasilensis]|uniref:Transglutaminase-like putative cysteine protease n=1 Tax=Paenibacillus brasilensis TaxID=128574 RepID=A0ABU0KUR2_9BACL|nr:transglutaminase domain-containing protein [Paenibacillus brasilensis]MDQ0493172.1 transglutaminase-like putative cysteine protease [Paenibacillus brasilensis]
MKSWLQSLKGSGALAFTFLWIIIIAMQWVSFASELWMEETRTLVLMTITMLALVKILLPFRPWIEFIIKAATLFFILYRTLVAYSIMIPFGGVANRLDQFISNMSPYIWFSLIAWLIIEMVPLIVTTKQRIIVFVGINIAALAVLDSFTPTVLWEEVAWIAFAGMGWLVTQHLQYFRQHYPQGWRHIRRYPYKIAANIAVIFALIIMVSVNMPEVQPTLTDPYTAWTQHNSASTVGINNGAGAMNQRMSTASGYSRQDNRLGGGFNFDYSPVMTITTNQRSYWRGESKRMYSGTGWSDAGNDDQTLNDVSMAAELENTQETRHSTEQVVQTITMQNDQSYPVLFGAYSIHRVQSVDRDSQSNGLHWNPEQAELLWSPGSRRTAYPKTYTLVSHVPVIPEKELRKKTYSDLYGANKQEAYLQIPDELPQRVRDLAKNITATAKTPYEKVGLLQRYLQQNYAYTNNPNLSRKRSKDFVDAFLFEIREGYCDYYSTSLVVMARSVGVPARWVKGYAPGQQTFSDEAATSDGDENMSSYSVTNADAHSWAEIYMGEYGWIPVEATPGFDMPLLTEQEDTKTPDTPEVKDQPEPDQSEQAPQNHSEEGLKIHPVIIAIAAAILVLWAAYIIWRTRADVHFYLLRLRRGKPLTPDEKVIVETEHWLRYMRRKGFARASHETLRESVGRWSIEAPERAALLQQLLGRFEQARYSPFSVTAEDWRQVREQASLLHKEGWTRRGAGRKAAPDQKDKD